LPLEDAPLIDAKIPHLLAHAIGTAFLLLLAPSPVGAIATTSCDTFAVVQLPGMDESVTTTRGRRPARAKHRTSSRS